jgi:hypothetical protein
MFTRNLHIHFKIINCWLFFVLFLILVSNLPHEPVPVLSWINCSIYFLLFLQCLFLFKKDENNRFIFFNIGLFSVFHSLTFINIFIGDQFLFGSDFLAYYLFEYRIIILSFLLVLCVVYLCMKYMLNTLSPWAIYLITLTIILPIFFWHYHPFLLDKEYILEIEDAVLFKHEMYFNLLPLFFIFLYGVLLYRYDRSLGEHINTIMVCFFIITIMDITNILGYIYKITIFSLSQYVLLVNLSFFLITMFRLLNYAYSEFGQFYNAIVTAGNDLGVPIKRKKSLSFSMLDLAKAYFHHRRNAIVFLTLVFICAINYFNVSLFIKLNLAVLSTGALIVFYYLTALYEKRLKNNNLLSIKRKR